MTVGTLLAAFALDAAVGDPRGMPHPVRLMGGAISWYDGRIRRIASGPSAQRIAGLLLALGLSIGAGAVAWILIALAGAEHAALAAVVETWLAYTTLAARDLADHVRAVRGALARGALPEARRAVGRVVGRDTARLPEPELVRATVETVAESTADGVIGPLLYLAIGGAPLAIAFKAVSTLDSMVGHRDQLHGDLGWASARLDDLANWVPARITGLLMVLASGLVIRRGGVTRRAWTILLRDAAKHPSPNSGRPEAAMAGALDVQLGGTNVYDGVPEERPRLGDPVRPLTIDRIDEALRLMWAVSLLGAGLAAGMLLP